MLQDSSSVYIPPLINKLIQDKFKLTLTFKNVIQGGHLHINRLKFLIRIHECKITINIDIQSIFEFNVPFCIALSFQLGQKQK